ncbi:ribonucleoside-diphosphate reductase subunit alpha [Candidatus Kaiserbacteria bacterium]|nr:ribonucleoside-diphosphate reductase subunit alpha [Candidatus Kaiserbacteria bacterium]
MKWLNEHSRAFLAKGYLNTGMTPEARIAEIGTIAETILEKPGFAKKFERYMAKGWYSLSSPVWSNFGLRKGLPISCFGSYISDTMASILLTQSEVGTMSKYGGGTSGYFGALRPRGAPIADNGTSSGSVHFMQLFETIVNVVSQGSVRRGHFSPYLPIDHPDIEEFLKIGTDGNPIQELTHAVVVPDTWMQHMVDGDEDKRRMWAKVIERRGQIGYPYILFVDNANNARPDVYKDKNLRIYASNLCSEIMLPSKDDWSFVCDLSSMNVLHFEAWKNTDAVETMVHLLDAVMTDFLQKLETLRDSESEDDREAFHFMRRAYNFARANRAIGVGVLGWHSLLQSRLIPFESHEAGKLNVEIFKTIHMQTLAASMKMAAEYGEPEILQGYGRRHATLMAIAPTTSSSFILGQVSQSIEPVWSNCYVKDIDKMKVTIKNPFLADILEKKGKNMKVVWDSIRDNDGSVQHLDFLDEKEKAVFRTFAEIDQAVIIDQAAARQHYIDQGQSLNLMVSSDMSPREINQLYMQAWKQGVKSLYYQHSMNAAQQLNRKKLQEMQKQDRTMANVCVTCEA